MTRNLAHLRMPTEDEQRVMMEQFLAQQQAAAGGAPVATPTAPPEPEAAPEAAPATGFVEDDPSTWGNPGRNEKCPCGSGKKFKHCHGRLT